MDSIKVGLLGLGVVGGGTYKVLARNALEIARRAGRTIEVTRVAVRDVAKARQLLGPALTVGTDPFAVVRD
ncbi:MAG: homoserine dehydrogenase, partial [Alcaligenaceae bacterium]